MKNIFKNKYQFILETLIEIIIGKIIVISTSKIKKIIAIKKKCKEKGKRLDDFGSNPHSKGDLFSRSENDFLEVKFKIKIKISINNKIMVNNNNNNLIIYAH